MPGVSDLTMTDLTALQAEPHIPDAAGVCADTRFDVQVHTRLADTESVWRGLEARAVVTPYQRFDWVTGLMAANAEPEGEAVVAIVRRHGVVVGVLPLIIRRRFGTAFARMMGAHQSNSDWLITSPDFSPSANELKALFAAVARAVGGIDLLVLMNQPASWQGKINPVLALPNLPAPSNLYTTTIGGTPAPFVDTRLSAKRRANINRGRRRLEEMLGPVRLVRVSDAAMLELVQAEFLKQRGERFDAMGVDNIFAQRPFPEFFREVTAQNFDARRPVLSAHALFAGDEIVATCWGATAGDHYSQYINSTSSGPAARYSLMGILVADLMDELIHAGITTFDMGLGDFEYKIDWTEPQPVYHSVLALTGRGRFASSLLRQRAALKRLIKQTPLLWTAARWVRRSVFQLRRR